MEPPPTVEFPFEEIQFSDTQSDTLYVPSQTSQTGTYESEFTTSTTTLKDPDPLEPESTIDEDELQMLNVDEIEEGDIPVSYHNALILNETYQNAVLEAIEALQLALERNQNRQEALSHELEELQKGHMTVAAQASLPQSEKRFINVFSSPYFKDERLFSHPPNPDSVQKKRNCELDPYLTNPKEWKESEKRSLRLAVKEDALRERMSRPMAKWESLLAESRRKNVPPERKVELLEQLRETKREIERIKALTDKELFHNREEDFDWMRISAQAFQGTISAKCCELMWKNMLHPTINRASWTREEDNLLMHLADTHQRTDWDQIALELDTNRTGFLCCMRYQLKWNRNSEKRKWTMTEDRRLRQLVAKCRLNNFIPWTKVAYYMDGRTKDQCYQRYVISLTEGLRSGAFTESEDFLVLAAVKFFGEQWRLISDYLPSRNASQILARYQNFLSVSLDSWTKEDDQRLLEAVKELGTKDWVKVAERTPGKSRLQCRRRFFGIYKKFITDPDQFNLGVECYRSRTRTNRSRQERLFERWNLCLEEFLNKYRDVQDQTDEPEPTEDNLPSTSEPKLAFRTTPEGVKIPIDAVEKFMRDLSTEIRNKDAISKVPDPVRKLTVPSCEVLGMVAPKPKSMLVVKNRLGKNRLEEKRGIGRPKVTPQALKGTLGQRMKNGLTLFMRPTWETRRSSRRIRGVTEEQFALFGQAMFNLGKVLKCNQSLNFTATEPEDPTDKPDDYILGAMEQYKRVIAQNDSKDPAIKEPEVAPPSPKRPKVRTYGRKNPQLITPTGAATSSSMEVDATPLPTASNRENPTSEPATTSISSELTTLPPNLSTLIGFRGMSLYNRYLQKRAAPDENIPLHVDFASLITNGIFHPDVILSASELEDMPSSLNSSTPTNARATESQADALLFHRFKALFLWPAIMASMKIPFDLSAKDNLFGSLKEDSPNGNDDEDSPLSAENPFDSTEIIQQSRQNIPSRKVRVINRPKQMKTSRPKATRKRTHDETNQSEESSQIDLKPEKTD